MKEIYIVIFFQRFHKIKGKKKRALQSQGFEGSIRPTEKGVTCQNVTL